MTSALERTACGSILIVDDNAMGLAARRSVLQELGFEVETCSSAQEALEQCLKRQFDIVITDYKMPKMDGVEFIKELRKQHPKMQVILISGFTDTLGLNEATTGADAVIQKSAHEVGHLIRSVNRLARKTPRKPTTPLRPDPGSKQRRA